MTTPDETRMAEAMEADYVAAKVKSARDADAAYISSQYPDNREGRRAAARAVKKALR